MKNLREYLEEQINENLIQAVLSAGRNKDGISKIKIRPIRLKGQICYQASATEGQKVLHKNYGRTELIEYVEKELAENFRQINRFLEFIEDILPRLSRDREITILDFGCGKSYLTFAMYYYLRELKGYDVNIIGLDLKTDVIEKCNSLALRYGYEKLHFYHGDIADYEGVSCVDMVVTLHACDTATDYALAKAVEWGAEVILSVPCCQHEVNKQIKNEMLEPVLRYGILKERMSALITDAVRADLLESKGYDTQILEFIDMEHTPKNLLIRAVRTGKRSDQGKVEKMLAALNIHPTLDRLLNEKEQEGSVR